MSKEKKSVYSDEIDWVEERLKPEIAKALPKGKRGIATFLVLAGNWGQGDAYAGLQLQNFPRKALETLTRLAKNLADVKLREGLITGMNDSASWAVMNLDEMADAFMVPEAADKVKVGRFW